MLFSLRLSNELCSRFFSETVFSRIRKAIDHFRAEKKGEVWIANLYKFFNYRKSHLLLSVFTVKQIYFGQKIYKKEQMQALKTNQNCN